MIRIACLAAACLAVSAPAALAQSPASPEAGHGHHHHADFQSGRFHVRVDGEGPDVILIPGLSSSPEVWDDTVAALGGHYRVHRLHIQGFAGAPAADNAQGPVAAPVAEDLARYIREQGLERPAVIGHSMGGTIALMLAARHPDLVGRLMVVDMIPFMGAMFGGPGATPESVAPIADQIQAGMADGPADAYRAQLESTINGMILTEARRAGPLEDGLTSDRRVSADAYRELIVTDLGPELDRITVPTEVVYAKFNDPRMTAAITDGIYAAAYARLPGVRLKRIDDSAHFIMLDQPDRFVAEVNAFLE
jgi:pimeloyl-ACP methyl ester carboxylesterase